MKTHVCIGGPVHEIEVDGRTYRFEMHSYFGPIPLNARDEEMRSVPRKLWTAIQRWMDCGEEFHANGRCKWSPVPDPREGMVHLGGNHYASPDVAKALGKDPTP